MRVFLVLLIHHFSTTHSRGPTECDPVSQVLTVAKLTSKNHPSNQYLPWHDSSGPTVRMVTRLAMAHLQLPPAQARLDSWKSGKWVQDSIPGVFELLGKAAVSWKMRAFLVLLIHHFSTHSRGPTEYDPV